MHHSTPLHDKLVASRTVTEILNHINPVIESVSAALRNLKDEPIKAARFANSVRVSLKLASTSAGVKTIEIGSIDASDVARTAGRDASKTQYREVTDTTGLDTSENPLHPQWFSQRSERCISDFVERGVQARFLREDRSACRCCRH